MRAVKIGIIGDYDENSPTHLQTNAALEHAAHSLGVELTMEWLPTEETHDLALFDGFWCAPGSPYRSLKGALTCVRYGRDQQKPLLGTCGGFQHVVLEYARNVTGFKDATHAEYDPYVSHLLINPLSCSLKGQSFRVQIEPNSRAAQAYGSESVEESYYCNFGLNPAYQQQLQNAGLRITGWDEHNNARIVELSELPFYLATLFVPQSRSSPGASHPLIRAFVAAACSSAATRDLTQHNAGLVVLRVFHSESEAAIARSVLEAFDVDCVLGCDDCGGQRPSLSFIEGIRLLVRSEDVVRAEEVLAGSDRT